MKKSYLSLVYIVLITQLFSNLHADRNQNTERAAIAGLGIVAGLLVKVGIDRYCHTKKCAKEAEKLDQLFIKYESNQKDSIKSIQEAQEDFKNARHIDRNCLDENGALRLASLEQLIFNVVNQCEQKKQLSMLQDLVVKYEKNNGAIDEAAQDLKALKAMSAASLSEESNATRRHLIDFLQSLVQKRQVDQQLHQIKEVKSYYHKELAMRNPKEIDLVQCALEKCGGQGSTPLTEYHQQFSMHYRKLKAVDARQLDPQQAKEFQDLLQLMDHINGTINSMLHKKIQEEQASNESSKHAKELRRVELALKEVELKSILESNDQLNQFLSKHYGLLESMARAVKDDSKMNKEEIEKMLREHKIMLEVQKQNNNQVSSALDALFKKYEKMIIALEQKLSSSSDQTNQLVRDLHELKREMKNIQQQLSALYLQNQVRHNTMVQQSGILEPSAPPLE